LIDCVSLLSTSDSFRVAILKIERERENAEGEGKGEQRRTPASSELPGSPTVCVAEGRKERKKKKKGGERKERIGACTALYYYQKIATRCDREKKSERKIQRFLNFAIGVNERTVLFDSSNGYITLFSKAKQAVSNNL